MLIKASSENMQFVKMQSEVNNKKQTTKHSTSKIHLIKASSENMQFVKMQSEVNNKKQTTTHSTSKIHLLL